MDELARYRRTILPVLRAFFAARERDLRREAPALIPLFRRAAVFTLRPESKRVRSFLVSVGERIVAGRTTRDVVRLSVIAELVHASLLIHDDIIDRDERRRGGPTVHAALRSVSPRPASAEHYGESQAILLGSLLGIWARQAVQEGPWQAQTKVKLLTIVERMMLATHLGEMLDVQLAERPSATSLEILRVHRLKTAEYSFVGPLHLGAVAAGASAEQLAVLRNYGIPTGIAFQIQDDILGLFGSERETGKAVGADIAEGKKTLLTTEAVRRTRGVKRARLQSALAARRNSRKTLSFIRAEVRASGSLAASEHLAQELVGEATAALVRARHLDPKGSTILKNLADFAVRRMA
jgi:geranylgeranyl diphosphate synthase type I